MPNIADLTEDGLIPTYICFKHNDLEFKIPLKANGGDWIFRNEDDAACSWGSDLYIHLNFRELFIRLMHEQLQIQTEAETEVARENEENEEPPTYSPVN